MINDFYTFTFIQAYKSNSIDIEALCFVLEEMPQNMRERFVEAAIGFVNPKSFIEGIPAKTNHHHHIGSKMISANYLLNEVTYFYEEDKTLYFHSKAHAKDYANCGAYDYEGVIKEDNEHPFKATHRFTHRNTTDSESWQRKDYKIDE